MIGNMGMEGLSKKVIEQSKGFFESPIAHKESFVINGAKVDTIDVKPEKQKIEVPVLVAPGWGATMKSFEPAIKVLADKERRVISLDHPRKGGTVPDSHNPEIEEWYKDRGQKYKCTYLPADTNIISASLERHFYPGHYHRQDTCGWPGIFMERCGRNTNSILIYRVILITPSRIPLF